jgi:oligopeptide/dipeptide ABC transporter ATP-binding protein
MTALAEPVLDVHDLALHYRRRRGARSERVVRAVDGVTFSLRSKQILAIVGESGCGKTSLIRAITRLEEPTEGNVLFRGRDIAHLDTKALRGVRREIQVIFQDPFESLDPRLSIFDTVEESLLVHRLGLTRGERRDKVIANLEQVGLYPADAIARQYPHQLSGGQRQRVVIAGAMVLDPSLVIADEPVSMLDVSLRAGILGLMLQLRDERGVSFLFVTHDLSLAWVIAERVAVVYLGRIVEIGDTEAIIGSPRHPYTQALVSVIPVPERRERLQRKLLVGEAPSASRIPAGCRFRPRCPLYRQLGEPERCREEDPVLREIGPGVVLEDPHDVACHFAKEKD